MSDTRGRRSRRSLVPVLVLLAAAIAGPVTAASAQVKTYTAVMSPDSVAAGSTETYSLEVTNTSGQQQLGSFDFTPAPGFTLVDGTESITQGTVDVVGNVLKARNLSLAPRSDLTATFDMTAQCADPNQAADILAKQANNFHGPPGNNLTLVAPSDLTTTVQGTCSLEFVADPEHAVKNVNITSVPFDPSGAPVQVRALDGLGNEIEGVPVTLAIQDNPGVGRLNGGSPPTANTNASGIATFASLWIDRSGPGYTLEATSGDDFDPDESEPFDIVDVYVNCETGPCTGTLSSTSGSTQITGTPGPGVQLSMSFYGELDCAGYDELQAEAVTWALTGEGLVEVVTTVSKRTMNALPQNGAAHLQVCMGKEEPFTQRDGTPASFDGTVGLYVGLLPDCSKQSPQPPCVTFRNKDRAGRGVIGFLAPAGDPRTRA